MNYTPAKLLCISAFTQNRGLQISPIMLGLLNQVESRNTITGDLAWIRQQSLVDSGVLSAINANAQGLSLQAPSYPRFANLPYVYGQGSWTYKPEDEVDGTNVTQAIRNRATYIMENGVSSFMGVFGSIVSECTTSFDLSGALSATDKFSDLSPGISNYTDLISGGLTSKFGARSINKNSTVSETKNSIRDLSLGLKGMGDLYEFNEPDSLGDPISLTKTLMNKGLVSSTTLLKRLMDDGININDLDNADSLKVQNALSSLKDSELKKVTSALNVTVPVGINLTDGRDLLNIKKLMPSNAVNSIKNGSFETLRESIKEYGTNFKDNSDFIGIMQNTEVTDFPSLNSLSKPLPPEDVTIIKNNMAKGMGVFGNPTVWDMIGTVVGYIHNVELKKILDYLKDLNNSSLSSAITNYASALEQYQTDLEIYNTDLSDYNIALAQYLLNPIGDPPVSPIAPIVPSGEASELVNQLNNYANHASFGGIDESVAKMLDQLMLEVNNCHVGGIDIRMQSDGSPIANVLSLGEYGKDRNNLGTFGFLCAMIVPDRYGESIKAVMVEAKNSELMNKVGIRPLTLPDASDTANEIYAKTGNTLSSIQKQNIISHAKSKNLNVEDALANATLYGYNDEYYQSLGYPSAGNAGIDTTSSLIEIKPVPNFNDIIV